VESIYQALVILIVLGLAGYIVVQEIKWALLRWHYGQAEKHKKYVDEHMRR
jgi:hypothetical protein